MRVDERVQLIKPGQSGVAIQVKRQGTHVTCNNGHVEGFKFTSIATDAVREFDAGVSPGVWIVCQRPSESEEWPQASLTTAMIFFGDFKADPGGWPSAHWKLYMRVRKHTLETTPGVLLPLCAGSVRNREIRWTSAFNDEEMRDSAVMNDE